LDPDNGVGDAACGALRSYSSVTGCGILGQGWLMGTSF